MDHLLAGQAYSVIDSKIGKEGVMGDLYRSWIIEFPENSSSISLAWNSWKEAKPLFSDSELLDVIRDHYPTFFDFNNLGEVVTEQRVVPEGILNLKGLVTIRVVTIKNYTFILLESY